MDPHVIVNLFALALWGDEEQAVRAYDLFAIEALSKAQRALYEALTGYIPKYQKAPGDAHSPDILNNALVRLPKSRDDLEELYGEALDVHRSGPNPEHIFHQASIQFQFARCTATFADIGDLLESSYTPEQRQTAVTKVREFARELLVEVEEAEPDPAININSQSGQREALASQETVKPFATGIPQFDEIGYGPRPGKMFVIMGPSGAGKTWAMLQLLTMANTLNNVPVLGIPLEMKAQSLGLRCLQMNARRGTFGGTVNVARLRAEEGILSGVDRVPQDVKTFEDDTKRLQQTMKAMRKRADFWLKAYPQGVFTAEHLERELDRLDREEKVFPRIVGVDYRGIMRLGAAETRRQTLGQHVVNLLRIAKERNIAIILNEQLNRAGARDGNARKEDAAEDISIVNHADAVWVLTRDERERYQNLLRIVGDKNRDTGGSAAMEILVSQAYGIGQFCVDSVRIPFRPERYQEILDAGTSALGGGHGTE